MDTQDDSPTPEDAPQEAIIEPDEEETPKTLDLGNRQVLIVLGIIALIVIVVVGVVVATKNPKKSSDQATQTTQAGGSLCGGAWPALYQGKPANLDAATDSGFYVWVDATGWHLRAIDTGSTTTFKGTITTATTIKDSKQYKMNPADAGTVTVKANTADFQFAGGPTAKGIDFSPCSASFRLDVGTLDLPWPAKQIWVGKNNKAVGNPMNIEREAK